MKRNYFFNETGGRLTDEMRQLRPITMSTIFIFITATSLPFINYMHIVYDSHMSETQSGMNTRT